MSSVGHGFTSEYREVLTLHRNGDYQTSASIVATGGASDATMQLAWTGRWRIAGDAFERDFIGIKAVSGERRGEPMPQSLLDRAADAFRSAPASERGRISQLTDHLLVIETDADPLTCKR